MKYCIIIPGAGCDNCIAEGVGFVKGNLDIFKKKENLAYVIFTDIDSKKILKHELSIPDLPNYDIIFDIDNKYLIDSKNSMYPCIVSLCNGEVVKVDYQCPDTPYVFSILKNSINKP